MPDAAIRTFAEWLASTPLSAWIASELWAIPTIQSFHILSLAIVLTSAVVLDLRILGLMSTHQPVSALARRHLPAVWMALVAAAITGTMLLIAEPVRSLTTWEFQSKMGMLVVVIVITVTFQRLIAARAPEWDAAPALPALPKLAATVSIVLWLLIILAGRWIAYHAS